MSRAKDELRERLNTALSEVTIAESVLDETLRVLGKGGPRAEKVAISADLSNAFARLRRAHEELTRVRDLLDSEETLESQE